MNENSVIRLFEDEKIRTAWNEEQGEWWLSIQERGCRFSRKF